MYGKNLTQLFLILIFIPRSKLLEDLFKKSFKIKEFDSFPKVHSKKTNIADLCFCFFNKL